MARGKTIPFDYGDDETLRARVDCLLAVTGATHTFIMKKALDQYLENYLKKNEGVRDEFEQERARRLSQGKNVSVLPMKSVGSEREKETENQGKETPGQGV